MKRRTEFIDIENRGFELSDMMLQGSLLAAMVADETVADAWDDNAFEGLFFDDAQERMTSMWLEAQRVSLAHLNRQMWLYNIPERTLS